MEEETFIVCMPVEGPPHYITPGSQIYACYDCGCQVTAAPSSQNMLKETGALVLCMNCALKRSTVEPPKSVSMVPGAEIEINDWRHRQ